MKTFGKPESNSDVVNREPRVLLIGYGWVGQYMAHYFKQANYLRSDGIIRRVKDDSVVIDTKSQTFQDTKQDIRYDLAIIGVPTPMNPETGQCDVSIVDKSVENYKDIVDYFLIKSTVEIGTTDMLAKKHDVKIGMSPEYVGETLAHPLLAPRRDGFLILGGTPHTANKIAEFFYLVLHANAPIHICTATEAEIIKYTENMWIMQRVDYWNDVYQIAETFGASYNAIREGITLDPRMSKTHSFVYKNNRGWSGKCLPKDMNGLAYIMRKMKRPLRLLELTIEKNAHFWRKFYKNAEKLIPSSPTWLRKVK